MSASRKLRLFLSYASQDLAAVRALYQRLSSEPWIDVWFDKENLLPGMDWDLEIYKALRAADAIIVCLSKESVAKEGYVQKEFKRALDYAEEKPEGTIYVIPLRLDECATPTKFQKWQWVDYFADGAYERLLRALMLRADALNIPISMIEFSGKGAKNVLGEALALKMMDEIPTELRPAMVAGKQEGPAIVEDLDLYRFIQIPATEEVPYSFWIGKYPVTNAHYARFLDAPDFGKEEYWKEFPKFNEDCIQIGRWKDEGWQWLQKESGGKRIEPRYWQDDNFGIGNPENPVVGVTWYEASAYCNWLYRHWRELAESRANPDLRPRLTRLPLETEWVLAAGGDQPEGRYTWDPPGKVTTEGRETIRRANVKESQIGHTTPVNAYLRGVSPYGVMDMTGNTWEWQANQRFAKNSYFVLRGSSWCTGRRNARHPVRLNLYPSDCRDINGFRLAALSI